MGSYINEHIDNMMIKKKVQMQHYFLKFNIVVHCSVAPVVSDSLQPHELQHARPPCPTLSLEVY